MCTSRCIDDFPAIDVDVGACVFDSVLSQFGTSGTRIRNPPLAHRSARPSSLRVCALLMHLVVDLYAVG